MPLYEDTVGGSTAQARLILGTAAYGTDVPEKRAWALLDRFAALGGVGLDTAHLYGAWRDGAYGASEAVIGRWLQARGSAADTLKVATKGGHPDYRSTRTRLSPEDLSRQLRESLERLGRPPDLYFLHKDDGTTPVEVLLEWLQAQRAAGHIGAYGLSNWSLERFTALDAAAVRLGIERPCVVQLGWSLAWQPPVLDAVNPLRVVDAGWYDWLARDGRVLWAFSALAKGFFGETDAASAPRKQLPRYEHPENRARLERARSIARRLGVTPTQVALAWLLQQPGQVCAIAGPNSVERLEQLWAAQALDLSAEVAAGLAPGCGWIEG